MRREFYSKSDRVKTSMQLTLIGGGIYHLDMVDAGLMYTALLSERPILRKEFLEALARHPCTDDNPWTAIIGFDEYTPED